MSSTQKRSSETAARDPARAARARRTVNVSKFVTSYTTAAAEAPLRR